ncbi:MAG: FAD-dependent oxidoreductase [Deltaproteobacteria bacterium]|nr:FAD-dependent oxidoreductase [Deltaproteobacteria bacterium]
MNEPAMIQIDTEIAIVGAGLCGLALARTLHARGQSCLLFEARSRLGGRVLGARSAGGMALDLGPTWFWPESEPHMAALVAELGLEAFPQHDSGAVLRMRDPEKDAEAFDQAIHGGAQRLRGGMAGLVQALSGSVPADTLRLAHELVALTDVGAHLELRFRNPADAPGAAETVIRARRVVLAVPPRVLLERVHFTPALDPQLVEAMRATPTWMGTQAKALMAYPQAFWRAAGQSGNAFVRHERAVLGEIFDACGGRDPEQDGAALGGFMAMNPEQRTQFEMGMPMLVRNQLAQLFGEAAEHGELHLHDWANEPHTCAALDRADPASDPEYGHPALTRSWCGGRLLFGGSETAQHGGGHMEGALDAALRLQHALAPTRAPQPVSALNAHCIERFAAWADGQGAPALAAYQRTLNERLSGQAREQLTHLSVLASLAETYDAALQQLAGLPFDTSGSVAQPGWSDLTAPALLPMHDFGTRLLDAALRFNRGSCAVSNFPGEHAPEPAYVEAIQRDMYAAWRSFVLAGNAILLQKA